MHIGEICTRSVVTCGRDTSVLELAQLMRDHHVGAVIVVDEQKGKLTSVGVVTDRDLVVEVMAKSVNPDLLRAGDLIANVFGITCRRQAPVRLMPWLGGSDVERFPTPDQQVPSIPSVRPPALSRASFPAPRTRGCGQTA